MSAVIVMIVMIVMKASLGPAARTLQMVASEKHASRRPRWQCVVDDLMSFGTWCSNQVATRSPPTNRPSNRPNNQATGQATNIRGYSRDRVFAPIADLMPKRSVIAEWGQSVRSSCSVTWRRSAAILAKVSRISIRVVSAGSAASVAATGF